MRPWKLAARRTLFSSTPFSIREDRLVCPRNGVEAPFYVMECNDWVNIVAITEADELVLVRQFRFGTEKESLEVPGGVVETDEDPQIAALRELREETGYEGTECHHLGSLEPNAAIQSNRCHMYLVTNCRRVGDQDLDPGEDVEVQLMPMARLPEALRNGEILHALSVAAFQLMAVRSRG